jgi:pimeloyl-ACP methyl ester carboxylesterase
MLRGKETAMRTALALLVLLIAPAFIVADYSVPKDAKFTVTDLKIKRAVELAEGKQAEFEIGAALRVPTGTKPETGWPAVLFISGSGSQSKHGFQGPLDLGTWELLDAISSAGFIVLSSDDRGIGETPVGEQGKDPTTIGYNDLIADARACLKHLQGHADVNKQRIFVIGHSEGGLTAPILAGEGGCAGIVCVAGPGRNLYDVIYEQVSDSNAGQPKATREANLKVQKEFQDAVKEDREPDYAIIGKAFEAQIKKVWQTQMLPAKAWMHEHFVLDVPKIHAAVECPALVTQGEADFQVKPEADGRQLAKNLMDGKCRDVTFKLYADLDHLFKPCGGKPSNLKMYYEDRRVDPTFIKDVVEWLKARA